MEILKAISSDEAQKIVDKSTITQFDRFKLDSFTIRTLSGEYPDMTNSELQEIYRLEIQNLKRLLNCTAILCGIYGQEALDKLMKIDFARKYVQQVNTDFSGNERDRVLFAGLLKFLIADCNQNNFNSPVFDGKVPQKMFKFRQTTAESWWKDYITIFCQVAGHIYSHLGSEEAFGYALANTAYYLNKSQPFKFYPKSSDLNMNDTITNICREYIGEMFGDSNLLNKGNVVFYKDL